MPSSRASAHELARLLDAMAEPLYVLDSQRRLAFLNDAARAWLGEGAGNLLGQECRYQTVPDEQGMIPLSGVLCPPPAVFVGHRATATIELPASTSAPNKRDVSFTPFLNEQGEVAWVLVVASVPATEGATGGLPASAEPSSAELHARLLRFRREQRERHHLDRLIGTGPAIRRIRAQVSMAAASAGSVLILGPRGTGRQHIARAIHYSRPLATLGPLVPLACPLLGAELMQSSIRAMLHTRETEGPEHLGTLLLNDVDQLPFEAQAELAGFLRVAELPIRIVSTGRVALVPLATLGKFRADLAGYLSTLVIELPPLAERIDDLPLLAQAFVEQENAAGPKQVGGIAPEALDVLAKHAWPGQLDELADVVREAHAATEGTKITLRDLPRRLFHAADAVRYAAKPEEPVVLEDFLAQVERELIERALARAKGNKTKAARMLGMTRPRLYRRLVQWGLAEERPDEAEAAEIPDFEEETPE